MIEPRIDRVITSYYEDGYDESTRLTSTVKGRLEAARTMDLCGVHFPKAPARIADIGGGPGHYARLFTEMGYEVDLLDPITRHVDHAKAQGIRAVVGDARELPWDDDTYDAVLLAGPLYHLTDSAERHQILTEAWRVLRRGGRLAAAALNRYAPLIGATVANNLDERAGMVQQIMWTGSCGLPSDDPWVNTAYYHWPNQLREELELADFANVDVRGIGGVGSWLAVVVSRYFGEDPEQWPQELRGEDPLATARLAASLADHPELVAASSHLMALAVKAY